MLLTIVMIVLVLVAGATMLVILLQTGNVGLGASIMGASSQMYGKKKGLDEVLERATMVLGALLMVLVLVAVRLWR
jgi:preprotein translocase subunit SecG